MKRKIIRVRLYFDESDPQNEGYAYRAYYSDGHEESDAYDALSTIITPSVATLLYHCETIAKDLGAENCSTSYCPTTTTTTTTTTSEN